MLVIRLFRTGRKNQPFFKIVVTDKRRPPRGGRFREQVGFLNPLTKEKGLKPERIKYWMEKGAKPSDTVYNLLIKEKILEGKKIPLHKKKKVKKESVAKPEEVKSEKQKPTEEKKEEKPKEEPKEEKKEEKTEEKEESKEEKTEERKEPASAPASATADREATADKKIMTDKEEKPKGS